MIDPAIMAACAAGEISPEIALSRLLLLGTAPDPAELARLATPGPLARLAVLADTYRDQLEPLSAFARAGLDPGDDAMAGTAALFDRFAAQAPEAGVAFYSLGDPAVLARATAELVSVIRAWAPPAGRRVVDLGCGIGRVSLALADEAAAVTGIDVSAGMVAAAQARSGGACATFVQGDGLRLPMIGDGAGDLVLAIDCWPFVVRAGADATDTLVAEIARVLAPGGDFLIFNWSYRGDPALDERDARALAQAHGFDVVRVGERPFELWDGVGFHLRRRA
ncbi:class I SAM-dependent methyltransferase [Novosphingobium sp.]|uniref:class I SAM-dependent methyltransferase n=1 Tax=Novosphingobium sp. TaxID=1874826 RepID=UPI003B52D5CD